MSVLTRRSVLVAAASIASGGWISAPIRQDEVVAPEHHDSGGRLTVPVNIDGAGPFFFAVDTAANASVVASDIAGRLGLPPAGDIEMHSLIAQEVVPTVRVGSLSSGALHKASTRLALGSRAGLDGTDGLLGGDVLADSRVVMRFRGGGGMTIGRSRAEGGYMFREDRRTLKFETRAERRFGTLMMIAAQSSGARARAIVDTGALVSLINTRMADQGRARPITLTTGSRTQKVQSPTGRTMEVAAALLPNIRFGSIILRDLPVLVADLHTFDIWGVQAEPAMLIGVDILALFSEVVVDIRRAELILQL